LPVLAVFSGPFSALVIAPARITRHYVLDRGGHEFFDFADSFGNGQSTSKYATPMFIWETNPSNLPI